MTCPKSYHLLGDGLKSNTGLLISRSGLVPPHYVWFKTELLKLFEFLKLFELLKFF